MCNSLKKINCTLLEMMCNSLKKNSQVTIMCNSHQKTQLHIKSLNAQLLEKK